VAPEGRSLKEDIIVVDFDRLIMIIVGLDGETGM
jgi:hypothetical protein